MASGQMAYLGQGIQPASFNFGLPASIVYTTTTVAASLPLYKETLYSTFQAIITGTGAVTATVQIQVTNDDNTGRGYVFGGVNGAPGGPATLTNASANVTAAPGTFSQSMVGALAVGPGVPAATTVLAVAVNGSSLTLSGNATASGLIQLNLFAQNWLATPLGVITLSGTNNTTDGFTSSAPWRYVRSNVTAISGTAAAVSALMGG